MRGAGVVPGEVVEGARAAHAIWPAVPVSITIAQWVVESAWGMAVPPNSNNPFGIKAILDEPFVVCATHEVIGGHRVEVLAHFRKFSNISEAFIAHARLLSVSPIYRRARLAKSPNDFANALTGTYATDPHYGALLIEIMREHNLYQYDVS